jgi:hypothetical protein
LIQAAQALGLFLLMVLSMTGILMWALVLFTALIVSVMAVGKQLTK